jgi:hypothetical protein
MPHVDPDLLKTIPVHGVAEGGRRRRHQVSPTIDIRTVRLRRNRRLDRARDS